MQALFEHENVGGLERRAPVAHEPPEHSPEHEEFGDDVARCEAESLALARMVADEGGELAASMQALRLGVLQVLRELADEGRHVSKLADPAESREGWNRVVAQPFGDDGEGEIPRFGPDLCGEVGEGC